MTTNKYGTDWTMPEWMEKYRGLIVNTGGNTVEELLNNKEAGLLTNAVLTVLIIAVKSQVGLLLRLQAKGRI